MIVRFLLALVAVTTHTDTLPLRPARIFADGMVVQRDRSLPVWGTANAKSRVIISFRGKSASSTSDASGHWRVTLPSGAAGGPFEMKIASGADQVVIRDVLVGDVWFASGQSNMEFGLAGARNGSATIAAANDSMIRQFKIPTSSATAPESELAGGSWNPADAKHAGAFSAVAYFFARDVRKTTHVPIGIINSSWGGSAIEAWLSASASGYGANAWDAISKAELAKDDSSFAALRVLIGGWPEHDAGLVDGKALWADPALDDRAWSTMPVPAYWDGHGYGAFDGIGWYRTTITLDSSTAAMPLAFALNGVDDNDITWINGVEVGRTQGNARGHSYTLSPGTLHAGSNVIAVRITDNGGGGGIVAPVKLLNTVTSAVVRNLGGTWKFRASEVFQKSVEERMRDGQRINHTPTLLFNKMVNPLREFPIKGVLWYQGESNANNDAQGIAYRAQFSALVKSWRKELSGGSAAMPFLWVQLPNYGDMDSLPPLHASWALVRESTSAARALPNTGEAITIDIGEGDNIHPKNKEDVGARLARVALHTVYGEHIEDSGPVYKSWTVRDHCAVVSFTHAKGLHGAGNAPVAGFELADTDTQFVWAPAEIRGETVRVCNDRVRAPAAVRYAFANNPAATLYNGAGLPAAPFRTDRW